MDQAFASYALRLRDFILRHAGISRGRVGWSVGGVDASSRACAGSEFNDLARELFSLQFGFNLPYRGLCQARGLSPQAVVDWRQIPAVPAAAFKEFDLTCLAPAERTCVFHSSGTTLQQPSRHFHSADSLALYEASLKPWWRTHLLPANDPRTPAMWLALTPPPRDAPHSSLVHMLATVLRDECEAGSEFAGTVAPDGSWLVDVDRLRNSAHRGIAAGQPVGLLGTAFTFVQVLDDLARNGLCFALPPGSRIMETGGYKGRSRELPRSQLHALMTRHFGVPTDQIVCEYGMSELSSQAYDAEVGSANDALRPKHGPTPRNFRFPPWARARIVSPEDGREVGEGETGLIQVVDLANAWSVMAIQTEDLGVRAGGGFQLLGRARLAEPRGCSRMSAGRLSGAGAFLPPA